MSNPWQRCSEACSGDLIKLITGPFKRAFRLHPRRGSLSSIWNNIEQVPWTENGFFHADDEDPGAFLDYHTGTIYPQDAASQLPVSLLNVQEDEVVLDACAAPGSKTTALALALNDSGCVIATDASPARRRVIRENVSRQGLINVVVSPLSIADLNDLHLRVDAALVDVPCSGHEQRSAKQVAKMAKKQLRILEQTAECVRLGGRLVYSTCTMYFEENEDVIDKFLELHDDWYIDKIETDALPVTEQGSVRLWPSDFGTEPFFSCLLRKKGESGTFLPKNSHLEYVEKLPYELPSGTYCLQHKHALLWCNELVARIDIPIQSRGLLVAEESSNGLRLNNWAAQALIERGQDAQEVSYADALRLWNGESLGACDAEMFLKTESGAPLGLTKSKDHRLNLSSRAFRTLR